jgi:hypothetical protein
MGLAYPGQLLTLLAAGRALLLNPHIAMDAYLHQLLPAVLTCMVRKTCVWFQLAQLMWNSSKGGANVNQA